MPAFEEAVIEVVRSIPSGQVLSYGEVAAEAGHPGAARAVGNLLRHTDADLPWWRVVRADGTLVAPDRRLQASQLASEGVAIEQGALLRVRPGVGSRDRATTP